MNNKW